MKAIGLWMGGFLIFASPLAAAEGRTTPAEANGSTATGPPPATPAFQPFPVAWPAEARSPADVSFLLPTPAGQDGFIQIKDGHLVRPGGQRFRIWGINATMQATVPPKTDAPVIAAHLARLGLNCVRFHFLDRPAPAGLIAPNRDDSRALDPQQLDRLDYFIAELKKRGIYANLNLNVGRTYKPGDGVRDHELLGFPKALTYFDGRLLELQREYARQLLTHVNPYTGAAYAREPAVALVEMVNENSLVEAWVNNRLLGRQTNRPSGTWNDIPPSYAQDLTDKFNAWLNKQLTPAVLGRLRAEAGVSATDPIPRLRREQFKQASKERFHAEAAFYLEVERDYFLGMARYLRDDLGLKALLVGNSDHGHGHSGYGILAGTSLLDVVDGHVYWQHPRYLNDPKTGRRSGFDIPNTPMVDDPLHSTVVQLSRSAVASKPYTVSEVNHPFPNEYACEGIPILAAYAALHDWDGLFWYTLAHKDLLTLENNVAGHFDFAKDPVKMSQLGTGALLFLRGDVQPAPRTVGRSYTREQVYESLRLPGAEWPYFTPGFPLALPLQSASRITAFDGPATGTFTPVAAGPYRSDTGELSWRSGARGSGLVLVDTPRSQALIGYVGRQEGRTKNLRAEIQTPFCALTLGALDHKPIAEANRLLLTATARVANTSMEWNEKRTSLTKWGSAPTCIEPVMGKLTLTALAPARAALAQPLDGAGRPLGQPIPLRRAAGDWTFELGTPPTVWFVLMVVR